jgi:hypothetical protein
MESLRATAKLSPPRAPRAKRAHYRYHYSNKSSGEIAAVKSFLRAFVFGLLIGAVVAFHLGMNYGRGRPLLSNPYEGLDLARAVENKAKGVVETGREKIHDMTAPDKPGK